MGSSHSSTAKKETERKRRLAEELTKNGVLIPPNFGVVDGGVLNDESNATSSSLASRDYLPYKEPSLLHDLSVRDVSFQLLHNYMSSGLWLQAQVATTKDASSTTDANVSFPTYDSYSTGTDSINGNSHRARRKNAVSQNYGRLVLTHPFVKYGGGTARLCVDMDPQNAPILVTSLGVPGITGLHVLGKIGTDGQGWIGTHFDHTNNKTGINVRVGSWVVPTAKTSASGAGLLPGHGSDGVDLIIPATTSARIRNTLSRISLNEVNAYASVQTLGATLAVQSKLPIETLQPATRSYFSINLTDEANAGLAANGAKNPPLVVTLERNSQNDTSALSLSQLMTFDRYQLNPAEDRAPYVRNTAGWTVRLERCGNQNGSGLDDADSIPITKFSVGGAWQINRAVAVKAVLHNNSGLTAAVVFKRWKQPRVTCSLLFGHDFSSKSVSSSGFRFVGVGLELETGRLSTTRKEQPEDEQLVSFPKKSIHLVNDDVPETKAALP